MKIKLIGLFLGLVTGGLIIVAQEPNPLPDVDPAPAPAIEPADPADPAEPAEPADPAVPAEPLGDLELPLPDAAPEGSAPVAPEGVPTVEPGDAPVDEVNVDMPAIDFEGIEALGAPAVTETPAVPVVPGVPVPSVSAEPAEAAGQDPVREEGAEVVPLIVIDEVPLTDAIRNLARQSGLNFQFDPRVTATASGEATNQPLVSIRFEDVTAEEALDAVLDNYNLQLVHDPRSRIARVTIKDPEAPEPLIAKIVQLKYSDPTNLVSLVQSTLSARSQVIAHPRTSQLIVTTTENEMEGAMQLIDSLDTAPRQVLIESHIIETSHSPETVKGIDWSGTAAAQNVAFGNNLGDSSGAPGANPILVGATPGKLLLDTAAGFNPGTAFLDADGVSAVLSFLNTDADTEVLSTPRAVTLDNRTALLSVTRAFPIFSVTPGSANSPAGAEVTYTNLGTILEVTPRIAADNNISLRVVPEVSNIDSVDQQVLNGAENTANIYAVRRIEANVMIPSGHTLVMGGLVSDSRTKQYVKVPMLGDLPGIGALFRHERKSQNKANLLIFVTPTIVQDMDFHVNNAGPEFLANRIRVAEDMKFDRAWDSAKPHDWTKPVY